MEYITFRLIDPNTKKIRYTGIKYKHSVFNEKDIQRIKKTGTSNKEIKNWIKTLKENNQTPIIEILYKGNSSQEACYIKQQDIINFLDPKFHFINKKIRKKFYTKKHRNNLEARRKIKDQFNNIYEGILEAAEKLMISPSNISKVLHGYLEHASGYIFSFV